MTILYNTAGTVNKGFLGQIAYSICLEKKYNKLDIHFEFDKQTISAISPEIEAEIQNTVKTKYGTVLAPQDIKDIAGQMKTEIQLIVMMNDEFIGGIHRQMTKRCLSISADTATEGGIPQSKIQGSLRVTLVFFNVLYDNTAYTLSVSAD